MDRLLLRPKEAQQALGCGRSKLYELFHTPGFPVVRLGERSIRIPLAGLQKWIADQGNGTNENEG